MAGKNAAHIQFNFQWRNPRNKEIYNILVSGHEYNAGKQSKVRKKKRSEIG